MMTLKETTIKMDYLEKKSRQNNIRIYNVKEGAEGEDIRFLENLVKDTKKSSECTMWPSVQRTEIDEHAQLLCAFWTGTQDNKFSNRRGRKGKYFFKAQEFTLTGTLPQKYNKKETNCTPSENTYRKTR